MAINVKDPKSPGAWLVKAFAKREARMPRLEKLAAWQAGNPPAPTAVETARKAFQAFEEEAVTNFAELITGSLRERMSVREIRTAQSEEDLDDIAWKHWLDNNMDVELSSIVETMLALGDAYAIVGKDSDTDEITVTAEDPRDVVTFHDPARQSKIRAAVKFLRDSDAGRDYAVLMLPGSVKDKINARRFVAYADISGEGAAGFDAESWAWDNDQGGAEGEELNHHLVPVVRFRNRNGLGEFEPHLKILRRINRSVFQLTVIVMYQAYKQRAVILDEGEDDEVRVQDSFQNEIGLEGLDDVLTSDPGSWFLLPRGAKIWESTQTDVQGILSAIKDDVMRLAAVTRRPMAIFAPDNQAAEGAKFTREGLTFAVEDKITRATQGLVDLYHLIFLTDGDVERADRSKIIVGWKPTERFSLTDMASATSQVAGTMPKRTIYRRVWQMTPQEILQVESEAADEALLMEEVTPDGNSA
ncbi:phage portal protein [Plantibacter sp. YIM 135249]|uniref:phage portal protein n=1 Tax=Plantibacter sp. YIM 135249 TaxID=3423918 RepID=UPI003D3334C2